MIRAIAFLLLIPTLVWAQNYPQSRSSFVNDFAELIDPETEARITQTLKDLRENQGIEMTVVTIGSVRDYGSSQSVPDFTTSLFNAWGVGDATRNDGIMFLTSVRDREMFIGLGSGYPAAYDDRMDRVFDYHVKPYFVQESYAQGIEAGVLETIKRTSTNFVEAVPKSNLVNRALGFLFKFLFFGIFIAVGVFILWGLLGKLLGDFSYKFRNCPNCGRRMLSRNRETTKKPTYEEQGQEHTRISCGNCDYHNESFTTLSRRSRSSSSSSGGSFGGGSSSGGGGGGRW